MYKDLLILLYSLWQMPTVAQNVICHCYHWVEQITNVPVTFSEGRSRTKDFSVWAVRPDVVYHIDVNSKAEVNRLTHAISSIAWYTNNECLWVQWYICFLEVKGEMFQVERGEAEFHCTLSSIALNEKSFIPFVLYNSWIHSLLLAILNSPCIVQIHFVSTTGI